MKCARSMAGRLVRRTSRTLSMSLLLVFGEVGEVGEVVLCSVHQSYLLCMSPMYYAPRTRPGPVTGQLVSSDSQSVSAFYLSQTKHRLYCTNVRHLPPPIGCSPLLQRGKRGGGSKIGRNSARAFWRNPHVVISRRRVRRTNSFLIGSWYSYSYSCSSCVYTRGCE